VAVSRFWCSLPVIVGDGELFDLPRLPRDDGGPVFAEPWQAQAFALAVKLSEQGHFTWKEWAAALAEELQTAARRGEPDDGSRYYEHWLAALERLVTDKGLTDRDALLTRRQAWAEAYRDTPHGTPVELQPSRMPDARWLLLGVAGTFAGYWLIHQITLASPGEMGVGFVASAGLGSLLGMQHAFEPDHLAAVATLMTGERSSAKAAWLGAWWGVGHTLTLLAAGTALVALRADMPASVATAFELCVVLLLVGFGARAIYHAAAGALPRRAHSHTSPGKKSTARLDRFTVARPLLVGAVHGLAGSGALTALVVATLR
jgi:nitrile hydratase accessory protein